MKKNCFYYVVCWCEFLHSIVDSGLHILKQMFYNRVHDSLFPLLCFFNKA